MMCPLVSVVVPFHNDERFANECLDALFRQSYDGPYEIVCVDDGSSDGTPDILDMWAEAHPSLIIAHHCCNAGLSEARNRGVKLSRGELITFVDADDLVSPHYLAVLTSAYDGDSTTFVRGERVIETNRTRLQCLAWSANGGLTVFEGDEAKRAFLLGKLSTAPWACLAHRSFYESVPFPVGHIYEDTWLFPHILEMAENVVVPDVPIYGYYRRIGSLSRPLSCISERDVGDFRAAIGGVKEIVDTWPQHLQHYAPRLMASLHFLLVRKAALLSGRRAALPYYRESSAYLREHLHELVRLCQEGFCLPSRLARYVLVATAPSLYGSVHRMRRAQKLRRLAKSA